jgi:TonB-linked SusC/RagA family outer membrane protein
MLQGTTPGLNITQTNGGLDSRSKINIRGIATIGQGSSGDPLVLIDGMEGSLDEINPQDIESISVLKDAASSSIYGSRAPFGVILVKTKSGKSEKIQVNYSNNMRASSPINMPEPMDSYTFALYVNDGALNSGGSPHYYPERIQRILDYQAGRITYENIPDPENPTQWAEPYAHANANNNWYEIMFKNTTFAQEHNLSFSGGNEKVNFYVSGNYLDQDGYIKFNNNSSDRYLITAKLDAQLTKWAKFSLSERFIRDKFKRPRWADQGQLFFWMGMQGYSTTPLYDSNGYLYSSPSSALATRDGGDLRRQLDVNYYQGQLTLEPIKNWKTFAEFNFRITNTWEHSEGLLVYNHDVSGNPYVYTRDGGTSWVSENSAQQNYSNINFYTEYSKAIGAHNFKGMIGYRSEDSKYVDVFAERDGVLNPDAPYLNSTTGTNPLSGTAVPPYVYGGYQSWATEGYFGRLNYNFKERYLAEFNLKYDGSSRFREENRWYYFPSFSLGWNIAKENFWRKNDDPLVRSFKVRASYGMLGNQNTNSLYPTYVTMPIGTANGGWLVNGVRPNTSTAPSLVSPSLTWEKIKSWNVGLDWEALNNRFTGSFDFYNRKTEDMVGPAPELPSTLGTAVPAENNTTLETYGWELLASWSDRFENGFGYNVVFTLADSQTKILNYPNETKNIYNYIPGRMYGDIWGYQTNGIAKSQEEMDQHLASLPNGGQDALGSNFEAGDVMYVDVNNDGKIDGGAGTLDNPGDRVVIGNTTPRYSYSFTLGADYKGIDIRAFFQGVGKRDYFNNTYYFWGMTDDRIWSTGFVQHTDYFRGDPDHPLGQNLGAYYPRPYFGSQKNLQVQSRYVQDVSYIRLKNLQIGYSFPKSLLSKYGMENLRVYVSGENLWTQSNIAGMFDPELIDQGNNNRQVSAGYSTPGGFVYPLSRTWSMGLNLTF